jgi:hypothetical protein
MSPPADPGGTAKRRRFLGIIQLPDSTFNMRSNAWNVNPLWSTIRKVKVPQVQTQMLRDFFAKKPVPLSGAPSVRRLKSYSAQSGYVYQYFYEGQRPLPHKSEPGTEFVFNVSADRKTAHPLSVLIPEDALRTWEQAHAHMLSSTERYAVSKMALFQAFDERATPELMNQEVRVRAADVAAILENLNID